MNVSAACPVPFFATIRACPGGALIGSYRPPPASLATIRACPGGALIDSYRHAARLSRHHPGLSRWSAD
jgi:hypothetical protein